jgi:hypothetical protein
MSELIFDNGAKCSANGKLGREKAFYSHFPGACVVNGVIKVLVVMGLQRFFYFTK